MEYASRKEEEGVDELVVSVVVIGRRWWLLIERLFLRDLMSHRIHSEAVFDQYEKGVWFE